MLPPPQAQLGQSHTLAPLTLIPIGNECGGVWGLFYLVPGMPKGLALQECLLFFVFFTYTFKIYNNLGLKRSCYDSIENSYYTTPTFPY